MEQKLQWLLAQNPLRTDFQQHYEQLVAEYNLQKDQATIERTFDTLLELIQDLDEEEGRAAREGLDEESLAIFDLLKKQQLSPAEIKQIKTVSVSLLEQLKTKIDQIDQWRDKEPTRDSIKVTIRDFLWAEETGLPVSSYSEEDVGIKAENVFAHVFRSYPLIPSPYYVAIAS